MTRHILALLTIAVASSLCVHAQTVTETRGTMIVTEGTRYVVAFPQVIAGPTEKPMPQPMLLFISSRSKTTVHVRTLAGGNDVPPIDKFYTVKADTVLRIPISTAFMNTESETRKGYGIIVTARHPISVSTYQAWMGNGELARHYPVSGWGTQYYSMNFYQDRYGKAAAGYKYRPSQILIIASQDTTEVSYTPTVDTEGGAETPSVRKGVTRTVRLNEGETYLIKDKINEASVKSWSSDLSGTLIRSTKPIGVVSGHTKGAIMRYPDILPPTGMFAAEAHFVRSNVHDALIPNEMGGTTFLTVPCMYTPTRRPGQESAEFGIDPTDGDVVRVIAMEDGTTITSMRKDGSGMVTRWVLNKGETALDSTIKDPTYWQSDKPILMGQYGKSYASIMPPVLSERGKDADKAQGHPTVESGMPMYQSVPSLDRWVDYAVFYAPEGMDNFLNIVFKTAEISKIMVNGRSLASSFGGALRLITGTEFGYIRTPVGDGDCRLSSTDPGVRWMAWTYGSLDGLSQGRAYGTPVAVDLVRPCNDSLLVVDSISCGDVVSECSITPGSDNCAVVSYVYPASLTNYQFATEDDAQTGRTVIRYQLNVLDKTKNASAVVRSVTRSGKYAERTYRYTPSAPISVTVIGSTSACAETEAVYNASGSDSHACEWNVTANGEIIGSASQQRVVVRWREATGRTDSVRLTVKDLGTGCREEAMLPVTVDEAPDARIAESLPGQLGASPTGPDTYSYQWLDGTQSIIPGATSSTYRPEQSGTYYVVVGLRACQDTSEPYTYVALSVEDADQGATDHITSITPVPAHHEVDIALDIRSKGVLSVETLDGRRIMTQNVDAYTPRLRLDVSMLTAGVYAVVVSTPGGIDRRVIVVAP